ncbi:OmpP1/FadL family transporter [Bacteroidota bacterium]
MKKIISLIIIGLFALQASFSQGIVSNTNQSANFLRMLARNASTDVDAVYYNPAGLVKMQDGFYLSLHNQSLFQTQTITNNSVLLNKNEFVGDVKAPIYPSFFGVYKKGKLAVSLGFGIVGGGGSAIFENGIPSAESVVAMLPGFITAAGIPTDQYSVSINFDAMSVYYGGQIGLSYALNKMISVSAGARYVYAKNNYTGAIKDAMVNPQHPLINPTGGMMSAETFFTMLQNPLYAANVADQELDAVQTGSAITPIFGINLSPVKRLNIGARYELGTKLELENDTPHDVNNMFPDGVVHRNDIPALLGIGGSYYITKKLKTSVSYTTYFDKDADWEGRETLVDKNTYDVAVGLEYLLNKKLVVSGGFSSSKSGVTEAYQSDMSYALSSNTIGFGFGYKASKKLSINVGGMLVIYQEGEHSPDYGIGSAVENLEKSTSGFAIGLCYKLF